MKRTLRMIIGKGFRWWPALGLLALAASAVACSTSSRASRRGALSPESAAPGGVSAAIRSTVRSYAEGGDARDIARLDRALHPRFRLAVHFGGKLLVLDKAGYLQQFRDKKFGGVPRRLAIEAVDVSGDVGLAKVRLSSKALVFVDYLAMLREGGRWTVLGSTPHVTPVKR